MCRQRQLTVDDDAKVPFISETLIRDYATKPSYTFTLASCCCETNHHHLGLGHLVGFSHASLSTRHSAKRTTAASAFTADVLCVAGVLVQVETVTGDNKGQLSRAQNTAAGPVYTILVEHPKNISCTAGIDHCILYRQYVGICDCQK